MDGSLRLPIDQRIEDSLDTDGLHMASTDAAIPDSNVGFQMLQKMGWKGQGLGSKEDGRTSPEETCKMVLKRIVSWLRHNLRQQNVGQHGEYDGLRGK